MKFKLNKKGSAFDISSQMILWFPRILFLIVFIIVVLAPIGCYSTGQKEQLIKLNNFKADLNAELIKNCIEKEGVNEIKLNKCFFKENVGAKVTFEGKEIILNKDIYDEKELCPKKPKCINPKQKSVVLNVDNNIKIILIDLVMIIE
ncbi:hypothetical protein HYX16_04525 [Candidatus Woesearchaeota archaeon]|nr:hypothetical protein [Candidatus Woesearchaeota archaeon]